MFMEEIQPAKVDATVLKWTKRKSRSLKHQCNYMHFALLHAADGSFLSTKLIADRKRVYTGVLLVAGSDLVLSPSQWSSHVVGKNLWKQVSI